MRIGRWLRSGLRDVVLLGCALAARPSGAEIGTPSFQWARCPASFCQTGWYASPAVADVDGDGVVEVVGGGYDLLAVPR
jgi:hypothetical protein